MIDILRSGALKTINSSNGHKSGLYQGVYMMAFAEPPQLHDSMAPVLIFDTHLLDQYPDYHLSNGWPFGSYTLNASPAFKTDRRRLSYHFNRIAKNETALHELVFRGDVSLDDLREIYLSKDCNGKLQDQLSDPAFKKFRDKIKLFETQ